MQLETIIISEASQKEKDKYRMIALICEISNESIYETEGFPWSLSWKWIRLTWRRPQPDSWVRKIPWRRGRLPTPVFLSFPGGSAGKESAYNVGGLGSVPGLGRYPGEGNGYPLHSSGLENSMGCVVHGVAKSQTRLSEFHFHFSFVYLIFQNFL